MVKAAIIDEKPSSHGEAGLSFYYTIVRA